MKTAIASIAIRATTVLLEFAAAILLARALGASGYGVFAFYFALLKMVTLPTSAGLPMLTVREVAYFNAQKEWGLLRGFLLRMNQSVIVLSVLMIGLSVVIFPSEPILYWMLAMVPLYALGNLRGGALRGLQRALQGQVAENIVRPSLFVLLIVASYSWLSSADAMMFNVVASAAAFVIGAWLLFRNMPREVYTAKAEMRDREWLVTAIPFTVVAGLQIINGQAGVIILGLLASDEDVGIFRIATQLALVSTFPLTALSYSLTGRIAHLHRMGDRGGIQRLVRFASLLTFGVALCVAAVLVFAGEPLIPLIFGEEFSGAFNPLLILLCGQLVNSATGVLFPLMKMVGHERTFAWSAGTSSLVNVGIALALVPAYGAIGAAMAVGLSMTGLNLWLAVFSIRRLGINPFPGGKWS